MVALKHSDACNRIRLEVSLMGGLALDYKTGALKDENGRLVRYGAPGASDLIACIGGRAVFVEVKVGRDTWKPEQQSFAKAVEAAGGIHILARFTDTEDGVETLRRALDAS